MGMFIIWFIMALPLMFMAAPGGSIPLPLAIMAVVPAITMLRISGGSADNCSSGIPEKF